MKWGVIIFFLMLSCLILLIILKKTNKNESHKLYPIDSLALTSTVGEKFIVTESNLQGNLVLNHFDSGCSLCIAEINDIIAFSKSKQTKVLFISMESLSSIQAFSNELKNQKVDTLLVSCAKIDSAAVIRLFGDFSTPKTILCNRGLIPIRKIDGLATYHQIIKGFE